MFRVLIVYRGTARLLCLLCFYAPISVMSLSIPCLSALISALMRLPMPMCADLYLRFYNSSLSASCASFHWFLCSSRRSCARPPALLHLYAGGCSIYAVGATQAITSTRSLLISLLLLFLQAARRKPSAPSRTCSDSWTRTLNSSRRDSRRESTSRSCRRSRTPSRQDVSSSSGCACY